MFTPGQMSTAPAGHVIVDRGPTADVEGGGGGGGAADAEVVTVAVKLHQELCPSLDRAFTFTLVVPTGNRLPDAGVPDTVTGATPPSVVAL